MINYYDYNDKCCSSSDDKTMNVSDYHNEGCASSSSYCVSGNPPPDCVQDATHVLALNMSMSDLRNCILSEINGFRDVIKSRSNKHTPLIYLHKSYLYNELDKMEKYTRELYKAAKQVYAQPDNCEQCPLYTDLKEKEKALAIVNTLVESGLITKEEGSTIRKQMV